jgi:hypothetical protein
MHSTMCVITVSNAMIGNVLQWADLKPAYQVDSKSSGDGGHIDLVCALTYFVAAFRRFRALACKIRSFSHGVCHERFELFFRGRVGRVIRILLTCGNQNAHFVRAFSPQGYLSPIAFLRSCLIIFVSAVHLPVNSVAHSINRKAILGIPASLLVHVSPAR